MIVPAEIYQAYQNSESTVKKIGEIVNQILQNYCKQKDFLFTSRVKSVESIAEKIESGRFKCWTDLDDLYACTIIVPNLNYETEVIKDLEYLFDIIVIRSRFNTQKSPDVFRFDATRIIAALKSVNIESILNKLLFEIQIKSAFEYAWSIATHSLTYKTNKPDWKRLRLSSQLKAVVEQVDMLILGFENTYSFIDESPHNSTETIKSICDFIQHLESTKILPNELIPRDLSRFGDNFYRLLYSCDKNINSNIKEYLNTLGEELSKLEKVPLSLSLFQLMFALAVNVNIIKPPLKGFNVSITTGLINLFPKMKSFTNSFELSE